MTRVAIIGARRCRQGIGEHVAKFVSRAGARIVAIAGTSRQTADEARDQLRARYGIDCRAYVGAEELLRSEEVDLLIICSPARFHREHLAAALERRLHVLCDKPLWGGSRTEDEDTGRIIQEFAARGLYLDLITQWPCTLAAFRDLHPTADLSAVRTFSMLMGPTGRGLEQVSEAAPHGISMLQALVGAGKAERIEVAPLRSYDDGLVLRFDYVHGSGTAEATLEFRHAPVSPRPAGYSINAHAVRRDIDLQSYAISFVGAGRTIKVEDPLKLRVEQFMERLSAGARTDANALLGGMRVLRDLEAGARDVLSPSAALR